MDLEGQNAFSDTELRLSRGLFGRAEETRVLQDLFESVCSGKSELLMIKGHAGTGKTSIVNRIIKPLARVKGYYGSGKFTQVSGGAPYAPVVQAFEEIAAQILTERKDRLESWGRHLHRVLGPNAALITDIIPRFKLILGPQPPVEKLQPKESQNRFRLVFQKLVQAFSAEGQPLVLFLDDLQWADPSSLELLRYLKSGREREYLLLVCAYRDDEVTVDHPLTACIDQLRQAGMEIRPLMLDDLSLAGTSVYVSGRLDIPEAQAGPLAEQLYRRTGGNPLFLGHILKLLLDDGILKQAAAGAWTWDMTTLRALEIPEDVVSFMTAKLLKLPEEARGLLMLAACIGSSFALSLLSQASEKDAAAVRAALHPAVLAGLILPGIDAFGQETYDFIHDRIHQAAYSLVPESQKKQMHYALGCLLLQSMSDREHEILPIAMNHCRLGLDLIDDAPSQLHMAQYFLAAARKAKNVTDYHTARRFLETGISLLPQDAWKKHYRLAFGLNQETAVCAYLVGDLEEAERLTDIIIHSAGTSLEMSEIYTLKMVMEASAGKHAEAVTFGLKALRLAGVSMSETPGKLPILAEILKVKGRLRGRKTEDLLTLPDMKDPEKKRIMKLMSLLGSIAISIRPELYILLLLKGTTLALRYGNSEMSAVAYAVYAVILGEVMGDYKSALDFERLSVMLAEKYGSAAAKCIAYFVAGGLVSHWTRPGQVSLGYLGKSAEYGMESGELLYTAYALYITIEEQFQLGASLQEIEQACRKWYGFAVQMKLDFLLASIIIIRQYLRALGISTAEPDAFGMDEAQETRLKEKMVGGDGMTAARYYFYQMHRCFLFRKIGEARVYAERVVEKRAALSGFMLSGTFTFYHALVLAAETDGQPHLSVIRKSLSRIKRMSEVCPEAFLRHFYLLSAEMARLNGEGWKAAAFYDKAVDAARGSGDIQVEAIANELAGRYYLSTEREKIAAVYLKESRRLYDDWGAAEKSQALALEFSGILTRQPGENDRRARKKDLVDVTPGDTESFGGATDPGVVARALDLIQRRDPGRQLTEFLDVLFEYAGADTGHLILESDGELYVEADKSGPQVTTKVIQPEDAEARTDLSQAVIRYVSRTQEAVFLCDGDRGIFDGDSYLAHSGPKTVLCLPILYEGILAGLLSLSSSRGADFFTPERLDTVRLLSEKLVCVEKVWRSLALDELPDVSDASRPGLEALTSRELDVLQLISSGLSNREIAESLTLSANTIKMHLSNIYGKLQVKRRVQAVNRAKELGILRVQ